MSLYNHFTVLLKNAMKTSTTTSTTASTTASSSSTSLSPSALSPSSRSPSPLAPISFLATPPFSKTAPQKEDQNHVEFTALPLEKKKPMIRPNYLVNHIIEQVDSLTCSSSKMGIAHHQENDNILYWQVPRMIKPMQLQHASKDQWQTFCKDMALLQSFYIAKSIASDSTNRAR